MRYYRCGTRLIAIEPNPHMHPSLARAAARHGVDLDIRAVGAEATGLPIEASTPWSARSCSARCPTRAPHSPRPAGSCAQADAWY